MAETEARPAPEGVSRITGIRWPRALPWGAVCALGRIPAFKTLPMSWMLAQDPRKLCKHLDLHGWELWQEVAAGRPDRPLRVRVSANDLWPLAVWSLAFYRGPVTLVWPPSGGAGERFRIDLGPRQSAGEDEAIEAHLQEDSIQGQPAELTLAAARQGRRLDLRLGSIKTRGGVGAEHR